MDLSIIIVSFKVKDLLEECLSSIFAQNFNFNFEIIVFDNASQDGSAEMVKQKFPQVKLIASGKNLGFAAGNNLGLKISTGKHLLLLNPDTKFTDNSLNKLLAKSENNPEIGILGCNLLNANGSPQPSVRRFPRLTDHLLMMLKLHHLFLLKKYLAVDFDYQKEAEVDQVMGAFMLIKRLVIDKIGLLDEKYYIWFEEVDYCLKAKKAGFKVVYSPESSIIHYGEQSFRQMLIFKQQWIYSKSRLRFLRLHGYGLDYLLILILTPASLLLSAVYFKKWKTNYSTKNSK